MKLIMVLFLSVYFCLPTFCLPVNKSEYEILKLLKSTEYEDQEKARELIDNLDEPGKTIIRAVFDALKTIELSDFSFENSRLIVKWGELSMPFLVQALNDKSDYNHWRAPRLVLRIARKHGAKVIIPAIPGLIGCIKEKDFLEKSDVLSALAELKELADDAVEVLTEEMISSKETDIHWSFLIAKALGEIAGPDYPPIQPFLKEEEEFSKQYVNEMDERIFKLEREFDVSNIEFKEEKVRHEMLVNSSVYLPFRLIKYMGINYEIAIKENKIKYIFTHDNNFMTDDGFKIGDTVKKLKKFGYSKFDKMQGWGYFVKLKSGWCAAFCEGKSCTDKELNDDSTIDWFFKYKY